MTDSSIRAEGRPRTGALVVAVAAVGAVGAYALATLVGGPSGEHLLGLPVVYAMAVTCAAGLAYLLFARAAVVGEDGLRWLAVGYALAGTAALLQALTLAEFSVADPFGTSASGAAALYLLWHAVLPTCALAALGTRVPAAARPLLVVVFSLLVAMSVWEPTALGLPLLVTPAGSFTLLYRVFVTALAVYAIVAAAAWAWRAGRRPTWLEVWIGVSLVLVAADVLFTATVGGFFEPLWWASTTLRAAQFAVPAAGLLVDLVRLMRALRAHERSLHERLQNELALATSETAQVRPVAPDARQRVEEVIAGRRIAIVLQPVYSLSSGEVVAAEALSRFPGHPSPGPGPWFRDAAAAGLGVDLELAAARAAIARAPDLPDDVALTVNMSPHTLTDPRCVELFAAAGRRVVVEVTEHAPVEDYRHLTEVLARLRRAGVRLAVDDAGAGFASFRHIVRLAPDFIKLDVSLVRDIDLDPVRRSLATALVDFAEKTGSLIIAEGVETPRELQTLGDLGVHCAQGFLLGRPAADLPVGAVPMPTLDSAS